MTVLSQQPSIGSLSGDWTEEQALLEQCITSGMPKTKNGENPSVGVVQDTPADENNEEVAAVTTTMETALEERKELHSLITTNQQVPSQQAIDLMQASADTWNDDMSPNDISFPSISLTAPLIASYRSNADDDRSVKCLYDISLTDSNIIRLEEGKVAIIAHMEMESSFMSDLDSVRPPSAMSSLLSLTASISEAEKRKDKMRGFVARRCISCKAWRRLEP